MDSDGNDLDLDKIDYLDSNVTNLCPLYWVYWLPQSIKSDFNTLIYNPISLLYIKISVSPMFELRNVSQECSYARNVFTSPEHPAPTLGLSTTVFLCCAIWSHMCVS